MMRLGRCGVLVGAVCASLLSACAHDELETEPFVTSTVKVESNTEHPQDSFVARGKLHFAEGSFGLAEQSFRQAVEANPKSSEAWLGLAASYDRLRRFDLADRAYKEVLAQQGRTVEVLNNLAYHSMLQGKLTEARSLLAEAGTKEPGNPVVIGNLRLLETWKSGEVAAAQR